LTSRGGRSRLVEVNDKGGGVTWRKAVQPSE
jgi:hypothetical protein